MQFLMFVGALMGLLIGIGGIAAASSDLQIIIGLIGFFSFLILLGLGTIMGKLDRPGA